MVERGKGSDRDGRGGWNKGLPAWNRGMEWSAEIREKISKAMLEHY
jgi:hypothetical protein